ncbi:MAG: hypothetical protein U0269_06600 [Polyangiales bacterium]
MLFTNAFLKSCALAALLAGSLLAHHGEAHAQSCASSSLRTVDARGPVTLTGTLRRGRGTHPARGRFTYYFIELSAPVCVANVESMSDPSLSDHDNVARFQIMNPARPRLGRPFTVTGTISEGHTAWHVEELLLIP